MSVDTKSFKVFREIPLLEGLSEQQMTEIRARLHRKAFPAGSHVITADQSAEAIYIVLSGSVKISLPNVDGSQVTFAILGPGQIVGEMSVLDDAYRSANVVTLEKTTLFWMDRGYFQSCLKTMPQLTHNLMRELTSRLRQANRQIEALASLDVASRVARQLVAFARQYGEKTSEGDLRISLPLTQSDVADIVGATREHVNRVIVTFKRRGYLAVASDHHLVVRDLAALAKESRAP